MLALTLYQPWASLIAWGEKQYETRDWYTPYRGPLIIHAAITAEHVEDALRVPQIYEALAGKDVLRLAFGCAVAVCDLANCIEMTESFITQQATEEIAFGLWEPGRFAWQLENVRQIKPIPIKGQRKLWPWPTDLLLEIIAQ